MLFPVILAIAVIVTFAGSAAAIRRAVRLDPVFALRGEAVSAPCRTRAQRSGREPRQAPHTSMFLRMLMRAAVLRRGRAASALFAMVVAAAVATAMLNLYVDVQAKLRREFRNYGANIILVGKDGASLPAGRLTQVDSVLAGRGIAAPIRAVSWRALQDGQPVVVAGTDFDRVQQLESMVVGDAVGRRDHRAGAGGRRALPLVSPQGQAFRSQLSRTRRSILTPAGTVQTGAAEDSRDISIA